MRALAFVLAFLFAQVGSVKVASSATLSLDERDDKNRPVSKVISLIKEMLKQLEAEAAEDQKVYDKMACWCETNEKEKTKSIADAEAHISDLTAKIEEYTALSTQLAAEIKQTEKEVAENQAALDKATSIREKQLAQFNDEEKDLTESISALKAALQVLGKHNSLLQMPRAHVQRVATTLQREMQSPLLEGALTHSQRRVAISFIQAPQDYFDAEPTFKQSYAPQSGEIYGILSQMKDTFEENLAASQKEETEGQAAYDEVRKGKEAEIAAGQAQIDSKTQELAETDEKNANAKVDLDDTKAAKAADEEFLAMLKEKCALTDKEFEERQKTRSEEIEACSKALAVLSSDDAHDLYTKTFNSFLQKQAVTKSKSRQQASMLLSSAASRLHSPRLSALATSVRLDSFTKVKQAIDDMVSALLKEKADEIKHKDFCIEELNTNQLQTEKQERKKADLEAKIEDLTMTIKELTKAIETLEAEIAEMSVQLKRAGEDREIENKAFKTTVADQRATQQLLKAALKVLEGFYGKQDSLLQQEPPPGFKKYENNALSGGVMGLISQIIEDAKVAEAEAIRAEEDAQTAYESFVKETNAGINSKTKDIMNKAEVKATTEQNLVETEASKEEVVTELGVLTDAATELHGACDFVLKNFEVRQSARDEEIQALRQAKAILSGAKFQEFLQRM